MLITDTRLPAVLRILSGQPEAPDSQPNGNVSNNEELVRLLAKPSFAPVLRNMIHTISSVAKEFALAAEFGKFLDLSAQGQTDVKVNKQDDGSFKQEYFLGNPDKPIASLSYGVADGRVQFTKLEILSASGELLSIENPKSVFDLDKVAFQKFTKEVFSPTANNYKYLQEFNNSTTKQQESTNDGVFIAARRENGSKPWLVAHLEKAAAGLRLKAFGKSDNPTTVSEPIALGKITTQDFLEQLIKTNNISNGEAKVSNPMLNLGTLAQTQAILTKANAELGRFEAQQKSRLRANPQARTEQKTINDFISSEDKKIIAASELQLIGFSEALPELLKQNKVKASFAASTEQVRGLLGESVNQEVNSLVLEVPSGDSLVKLVVPFASRESGIQVSGFLISDLQFVDPVSQKQTTYSLDLCSKMEAAAFQNTVSLLKPEIQKLLTARSKPSLTLLKEKLDDTKSLKIVSSPKVSDIGYATIRSDAEHSFVMKFDLNSKALIAVAQVPLSSITIGYENLARIISAAESYIYGRPAGGKEAANSGGTPLLYLNNQAKQELNTGIGDKINLAIKNQEQIASFREKFIGSTLQVISAPAKPDSSDSELAYAIVALDDTQSFVMQFNPKSKKIIAVTSALASSTVADPSFANLTQVVQNARTLNFGDLEKREIEESLEAKTAEPS